MFLCPEVFSHKALPSNTRVRSSLRVYGQFCIETLHERQKRMVCLAYSNKKTKCQNDLYIRQNQKK